MLHNDIKRTADDVRGIAAKLKRGEISIEKAASELDGIEDKLKDYARRASYIDDHE